MTGPAFVIRIESVSYPDYVGVVTPGGGRLCCPTLAEVPKEAGYSSRADAIKALADARQRVEFRAPELYGGGAAYRDGLIERLASATIEQL